VKLNYKHKKKQLKESQRHNREAELKNRHLNSKPVDDSDDDLDDCLGDLLA